MSNIGNKDIMARNLKYYMAQSGKDRRELCELWGFPYSTVTEWLNAKKYPRIDRIEIMAEYFGIRKSDLIEDKRVKSEQHPARSGSDMIMGDVIKSLRLGSNLTLAECSSEIGIPINELKQYESGNKQLPASIINLIAGFFGITSADITDRLLHSIDKDEVRLALNREYVTQIRDWNREFGYNAFTEEERQQLFQFARFLISKRKQ